MKHPLISRLTLFFSIVALLLACGSPGAEQESESGGEATAPSDGNCVSRPDPTTLSRFDTVNILVETSGSMAGFMPTQGSQTKFQRQLDDLLANAEADDAATLQLFSAGQRIQPLTTQQFRKMLRQGLKETTASTALPNLLRQVAAQHTGPGQVSLFISDFIYAPPNAADRDYISNDIRRALGRIEREGLAIAIYGFQSEFNGTFYPAGAKSGGTGQPLRNCCETELPYYLWAIGPEDALRRVRSQLLPQTQEAVVEFGFARAQPAYQVLPGAGRSGSWYMQQAQTPTISLDNTREISAGETKFTVGLNLSHLPAQWNSTAYLQKHLTVEVDNGAAKILSVADRSEFESSERLTARDRNLLACFSHYVSLQVTEIGNRNQPVRVNLNLPAQLPPWAEAWTTTDDRRPDESGAKTFAWADIVTGVETLYEQEQEAVFSLPVTLQKAN